MCMYYMSRVDSGQPNVTQMSQASGWTAAAMSTALAGATIASLRLNCTNDQAGPQRLHAFPRDTVRLHAMTHAMCPSIKKNARTNASSSCQLSGLALSDETCQSGVASSNCDSDSIPPTEMRRRRESVTIGASRLQPKLCMVCAAMPDRRLIL